MALVSAQQTVLLSTKDKFSDVPGPDHSYDAHSDCVPKAVYENLLSRYQSLQTKNHKNLNEKQYFKRRYEQNRKMNRALKSGQSLPKITKDRVIRNELGSSSLMTPAVLDIYLSKR